MHATQRLVGNAKSNATRHAPGGNRRRRVNILWIYKEDENPIISVSSSYHIKTDMNGQLFKIIKNFYYLDIVTSALLYLLLQVRSLNFTLYAMASHCFPWNTRM